MDIVPLNIRPRKTSVRRHTTELRLEHMPWNTAPNMDFLEPCLSQGSLTMPRMEKATSSNSIHSDMETSGEIYDQVGCSQGGIQQELLDLGESLNDPNHNKYLSYEQALVEGNLYPALVSQGSQRRISHASHVITEIVTTERNYVTDLNEIIEGYYVPLLTKVGVHVYNITDEILKALFGNIESIKDFNQQLLEHLEQGKSAEHIGRCFMDEVEKFKLLYTSYCNNYANSMKVLAKMSKDSGTSRLLKDLQRNVGHMLPLGAYLLKPVQRVMRYPLLLKDLDKHLKPTEDHGIIKSALVEMTKVAEHINAMKKKYEESDVKIQEIQNLIRGTETPDLSKYGDFVMEDTFRSQSGRFRSSSVRHLYLFQRLLLVIKKDDEGYQYKTHLEMKDIQMTENVDNKNAFEIRSISTGQYYTFQAFSMQVKKKWVDAIKKLLIDSLPDIPDKAKQLILGGFPIEQKSPRGRTMADGKSRPHSGRVRSATATVPSKKLVSIPPAPQSATVTPDRAFSPTKLLVAGLIGGGNQMFFPGEHRMSTPVIEEPAAAEGKKNDEVPPLAMNNEPDISDKPPPEESLSHLHRKNCIRKPLHHVARSPSPEYKSIPTSNGIDRISPLKFSTDTASNNNEFTMSQQGSDVSGSSPIPEKPLTPGGSLDTEQLFGDMILAPSTSPPLPPFPLPTSSPFSNTEERSSTLSPDGATPPADSPKLPRADTVEGLDDIASLPPADDAQIMVENIMPIVDEHIIIPAPPEFSECSQISNVSDSDSKVFQFTASSSMQVVKDVILAMEQQIATPPAKQPCNVESQVAQPALKNIATVGTGSEQTLPCSSPNDSLRDAVASDVSNASTAPASGSLITKNRYTSEIQITVPAQNISLEEVHVPQNGHTKHHHTLKHAHTYDSTSRPEPEAAPNAPRPPQSRVHQLAREFSKKMRKDVEVPQASPEVSKDHPSQWAKRQKPKKGMSGIESEDSDTSPQQPQKPVTKLLRQKSLTMGRFNSTKDATAAGANASGESSKGNASVPEKRKAFTMGPSISSDSTGVHSSDKSTAPPVASPGKFKSVSSTKAPQPTTTPKAPLKVFSPERSLSPQPASPGSEISQSKNSSEELNGAGSPATSDEAVSVQRKSTKQKAQTLHRLSVVDPPTDSHSMQRAVSEANLTQSTVPTETEPQQRQRFKGWVKSLVDKFSTK